MEAKNNAEGGGQKRRRTRTAFSHYQLMTLENAFSHNHYPDVVMREQLTIWTGLPDSTIQVYMKILRRTASEQINFPFCSGHIPNFP